MSPKYQSHRRLIASLFGTLKLMQMYGERHDATSEAVGNLSDAVIDAAGSAEETTISLRGSRLQINGRAMRARECGNLALTYIAEEWSTRQIAAVHIRVDAGVEEIAAFVRTFLDIAGERDPADALTTALLSQGVRRVAIERREESDADPVMQEERRDATMRTYLQGLRAFKEVLRADGIQDRTKVRRARRAVQGLVDRFLEDEAAVLTLAQIRGHDVKLFHHCMNVSLYALAIGQRIGMSRRQLGELGLAALFHDLGKTVPVGRRAGEREGDARRRTLLEHPSRGARMLLAESANHEGMLKAAIAAYEQHAHYDLSGFPQVNHQLHLFSRIITIADCYEALTSQRAHNDPVHTPYEAFSLMQARSGTIFDPLLFKVFTNAIGIYPVGSLVVLTSGEIAMVIAGPADPKCMDRPRVRILETARGTLDKDAEVDLDARDVDGEPQRSIRATLDAHEIFPSVGDLVAAV